MAQHKHILCRDDRDELDSTVHFGFFVETKSNGVEHKNYKLFYFELFRFVNISGTLFVILIVVVSI